MYGPVSVSSVPASSSTVKEETDILVEVEGLTSRSEVEKVIPPGEARRPDGLLMAENIKEMDHGYTRSMKLPRT